MWVKRRWFAVQLVCSSLEHSLIFKIKIMNQDSEFMDDENKEPKLPLTI